MTTSEMTSCLDNEFGERYRHLLQPIRDISRNWEHNIAEYLDEYLEKLKLDRERNSKSQSGEIVKFNFTEAAMLIQCSLRIFCHKVDYLYNIIYEAYIDVANHNGRKRKNHCRQRSDDTGNSSSVVDHLNNDFELCDLKAKMLTETVNLQWFLQNDQKRESKYPAKVGCCRELGRRDRFVDLPISFVPTCKFTSSEHHFCFKQNNEDIYVPQSDTFSFNAIAYTSHDGSNITVFMNPAYFQLLHSFSKNYIPYLRDENNQRLKHIASPYNIEVPLEVYARVLKLDRRRIQDNKPQEILEFSYTANEWDDNNTITLNENRHDKKHKSRLLKLPSNIGCLNQQTSLEEPRNSVSLANNILTDFIERRSLALNRDLLSLEGPPETSFAMGTLSGVSLRFNSSMSSTIQTMVKPPVNVEEELEFLDEYVEIKLKLRKHLGSTGKSKRKILIRYSKELCQMRDEELKKRFREQNKDYEAYRCSINEYIIDRILTNKLCCSGSYLYNCAPILRDLQTRALNRVLYVQEKYERAVKTQRRAIERIKKKQEKEQKQKRKQKQLKLKSLETKRRRLSCYADEAEKNKYGLFQNSVHVISDSHALNNTFVDDADYFGLQIDDDEDSLMENNTDNEQEEYNPALLMEREIQELKKTNQDRNFNSDDIAYKNDSFNKIMVFSDRILDQPESQYHLDGSLLMHNDLVASDSQITTNSLNDIECSLSEYKTSVTSDPAFFDLQKLADFFAKVEFKLITDDLLLIQAIKNFWTAIHERDVSVPRQRLERWSARISERLNEEAQHKSFKICEYGLAVFNLFGSDAVGKILKFKQIVKGVAKYEVSRYLLAILVLANCGNVQIINEGESWNSIGQPIINGQTSIKLLSTKRHDEVLQNEQLIITG